MLSLDKWRIQLARLGSIVHYIGRTAYTPHLLCFGALIFPQMQAAAAGGAMFYIQIFHSLLMKSITYNGRFSKSIVI